VEKGGERTDARLRIMSDGALYLDIGDQHEGLSGSRHFPTIDTIVLRYGVDEVDIPMPQSSGAGDPLTFRMAADTFSGWIDKKGTENRAGIVITFEDVDMPTHLSSGSSAYPTRITLYPDTIREQLTYAKAPPFMSSSAPE
jgi:hypothetical protein